MLSLVAFIALAKLTRQEPQLPDTIPAKRLAEFLTAMNTQAPDKIAVMVTSNFAASALKVTPKEEWVSRITSSAAALAPVSVEAVVQSSDTTILVRLKTKPGGPRVLRLDLELDKPWGIVVAHLGTPDEVLNGTAPKKYSDWRSLFELAEEVRKDSKLPGIAVAYQVTGKPIESAAVGVRSKDTGIALAPSDRLLIGEIGKTMTATLIAHLIELKKLSWNTTIGGTLENVKMADEYKSVTLDQLLHHKGNLPVAPNLSGEALDKVVGKAQSATDLRKNYVTMLLALPPVNPSATNGNAASTNTDADYIVAGYMAEHAINQSYEWLMKRYVYEPMSLNSVYIAPIGSDDQFGSANYVVGHVLGDLGYVPFLPPITLMDTVMAPAGRGVSCTVEDLLKFGEFNLRGLKGEPKVLSVESYKLLHTPDPAVGDGKTAFGWTVDPSLDGEQCDSATGTDGTYYANLTIWPAANLVAVAITNGALRRTPPPTMQVIMAIRDKLEKR